MIVFLRITGKEQSGKRLWGGGGTHALAPAEIHCIVRALRCADEWHTAAGPRRRLGWPAPAPAPRGCGFRGSEAHPLRKCTPPRHSLD
jgi:hypothetical protein